MIDDMIASRRTDPAHRATSRRKEAPSWVEPSWQGEYHRMVIIQWYDDGGDDDDGSDGDDVGDDDDGDGIEDSGVVGPSILLNQRGTK